MSGSAGGGGTVEPTAALDPQALPVETHVLASDRETTLVETVDVGSRCDLHAVGLDGPQNTMRLMPDGGGNVVFRFQPESSTSVGLFDLDCTAPDGVLTRRTLALRGTTPGSGEADGDATPFGAIVQPALDDPDGIAQDELLRHGYPRRPDARSEADAYVRWRRRVTREAHVLHGGKAFPSGQRITDVGGDAGVGAMANWSGCYKENALPPGGIGNAPPPFVRAEGLLVVPTLAATQPSGSVAAAVWVGMGGVWNHTTQCRTISPIPLEATADYIYFPLCWNVYSDSADDGNTPIIQAGSVSIVRYNGGTATANFTWYEYETPQPTGDPHIGWVQAFNVSPSDTLYVTAQATDADGYLNAAAPYATFFIDDDTSNTFFDSPVYAQPPTTQAYVGETAELIVERPRFNGVNSDLAGFGATTMDGYGQNLTDDENGTAELPNQTVSMVDPSDNNTLATAAVGEYGSCTVTWRDHY